MTEQQPVASLLRQIRQERGTSLRAAAQDIGIAPSHLSRLERGEKGGSRDVVKRAADYYGIEADALAPPALPADLARILREHPEVIAELRHRYGG